MVEDLLGNPLHMMTFGKTVEMGFSANTKRLKRNIVSCRKMITELINERLTSEAPARKDFMCLYIESLKKKEMTADDIIDNFLFFVIAGHESGSHLVSAALFRLGRNPEVKEKILAELKTVILKGGNGKIEDLIDSDNINELPYLHAVVKETLRIDSTSSISTSYYAKEDVLLRGVLIPKGQIIYTGISALHNNPDNWEEPRQFIPERFLSGTKYSSRPDGTKRNPASYNPFGIGLRNCVG
jgi:cytochrome P450